VPANNAIANAEDEREIIHRTTQPGIRNRRPVAAA